MKIDSFETVVDVVAGVVAGDVENGDPQQVLVSASFKISWTSLN
jgi:hypothetical protein